MSGHLGSARHCAALCVDTLQPKRARGRTLVEVGHRCVLGYPRVAPNRGGRVVAAGHPRGAAASGPEQQDVATEVRPIHIEHAVPVEIAHRGVKALEPRTVKRRSGLSAA